MKLRGVMLSLLACLAAGGVAAEDGGVPLSAAPRTFQLANGLHVALAPDSFATTVDVALWFPAGTRFERSGQTGLTHLVDGLLFAGTTRYPSGEHLRLIQREGGAVSAFSTPDFACADDNVPPSALDLALRLEADRMAHLSLTASSLEDARAALRREHQTSQEKSPLGRSLRRLYEVAFAGHPYRYPAQGSEADLARLTLPVAQAWWRDHYGPAGTWLTVTGNFEPDSAQALVRRAFDAVPSRGAPRTEPAPPSRQIVERRATGAVEAQVSLLLVGWRTASRSAADAPALDMLDRLLARGAHSPLERALVSDSSVALAIESGLDLRRDGGLFYVVAAIRPNVDTTEAEREVLGKIDRLVREPLAPADLEGAIKKAETETFLGWQTSQGQGRALGISACVEGDLGAEGRKLDRARQLTPASLRETAERTFSEAQRTIVWMHPAPAASPPAAPLHPAKPRSTPASRKEGR